MQANQKSKEGKNERLPHRLVLSQSLTDSAVDERRISAQASEPFTVWYRQLLTQVPYLSECLSPPCLLQHLYQLWMHFNQLLGIGQVLVVTVKCCATGRYNRDKKDGSEGTFERLSIITPCRKHCLVQGVVIEVVRYRF